MSPDPAVVLLPPVGRRGLDGAAAADWSAAAVSLSRGGSVLTPDLTPAPRRAVVLEDPALTVLAAISAAGLDSAAVAGAGWGAMVALTVAAGFGDRVDALVLGTARTPESTAVLSLHHGWQGLLPAATAQRLGATPAQVVGLFDQVRPSDYRSWVARVDVPALVLVGDRDVANLGPSTRLATALPHARLQVVRDAGSGWVTTQPDRYAELVWSYLAAGA